MYKLSTSMMCANPFLLQSQIEVIDMKTDYYHIDIMDGHFVPNLTLSVDYVRYLKTVATKPIDVHLMVNNPGDYIDALIKIGVDCISFHIETTPQSAFRIINKVKQSGVKIGIVISPRYSVEEYKLFLPLIDKVIVMTVEPGFAGQKMIEEVLPKITELKHRRASEGYSYNIEVDGSNNYSTFLRYKEAGADISILGTGLFNAPSLSDEFDKIQEFINNGDVSEEFILGIDVGGTNIRYGLVDRNFATSHIARIKTIDNEFEFSNWLKKLILSDFQNYNIKSVSIGFPGIVNPHTSHIISLPNLKGLENSDFIKNLQKEIKAKILIQKDTVHLLAHDIHRFSLKDRNVIGFYLGTGFGCSIYIHSKFHLGDTFSSGEVGHLNVFDNSNSCGCGNVGCSETKVSGWYLESIRSKSFPQTQISDIFTNHKDSNEVKHFIIDLAKVLSITINLMDVSNIVLGGGVVNINDFPMQQLIDELMPRLRSDDMRNVIQIFKSDMNSYDGIIGSAVFAKENNS